MRWLLTIFTLLMLGVIAVAQETSPALSAQLISDSLRQPLQKADTVVKSSRNRLDAVKRTIKGFDRLEDDYIEPQHYDFTVMMQASRSFEWFFLGSGVQTVTLKPDDTTRFGPYFGWRWIFLGYTFDLKNIGFDVGGGIKPEIDLSIYSSQVGVDLFYRKTGSDYKIRSVHLSDDKTEKLIDGLPFAGVKVGITGVNAYYIFNHGRFSYPAAFAQSTCQKVSCGSWMAGIGYMRNSLDLDYTELQNTLRKLDDGNNMKLDSALMFNHIEYSDFLVSGGYAYNWVPLKNLLVCGSAQLAIAYKTSLGKLANERKGFDISKVNPDVIGRFAVVYNNTRWYAGSSLILRTNNYSSSGFKALQLFGSVNLYVGYNFVLKKKYRNKT